MTNFKKSLLALAVLLVGIGLTVSWIERPKRIRLEFFGHLFHERYEEAALMLNAPCAIELAPDGSLTLVDHKGNSTTVAETKLPFKVSGGKSKRPGVHSMTALGNRTNGILDSPAVTIYLSVEGGKIRIESLDKGFPESRAI